MWEEIKRKNDPQPACGAHKCIQTARQRNKVMAVTPTVWLGLCNPLPSDWLLIKRMAGNTEQDFDKLGSTSAVNS